MRYQLFAILLWLQPSAIEALAIPPLAVHNKYVTLYILPLAVHTTSGHTTSGCTYYLGFKQYHAVMDLWRL